MASIKAKPALVTLRALLSELRKQTPKKKLGESDIVKYVMEQYRKHQTTDQQLCKAVDEMHFKARTFYSYLNSSRTYKEINAAYKGKGEMSIKDTADMVGFKLPHDPK